MPLKTPQEYVDNLRAMKIRAYIGGERSPMSSTIPAWHPMSTRWRRPTNWHKPEYQAIMTATSHLTGQTIHATHIFQSADDLVKRSRCCAC
jgi:4-hydroxybutyryl-CoA dehydratase/vinylacetyl-CoA-Delta-isomerase